MTAPLTCLVVLGFYALVYRNLVGRLGGLADWLLTGSRSTKQHSLRDVNDALKLVGAAVTQLAFALTLGAVTGTTTDGGLLALAAVPTLLAALLGLAELSLSATLGRTAVLASPEERATRWLAEGRGGWMRQFGALSRVAHPAAAVTVVVLYVTGEEIVFRAVLVGVLDPYGWLVAVVVSTALFVAVQGFGMPSLAAAVFPMLGAGVVGVVHSLLFLQVPALVPLIVAHSVFLIGALAPRPSRRPAAIGWS